MLALPKPLSVRPQAHRGHAAFQVPSRVLPEVYRPAGQAMQAQNCHGWVGVVFKLRPVGSTARIPCPGRRLSPR